MTITTSLTTGPPSADERHSLRPLLGGVRDDAAVSITINGRSQDLDTAATSAVLDLLQRLASGQTVMVSSVDELVTTGQAASLLGVSRTYVCRLMDNGRLPFEYRGTHRKVRVADLLDHLREQRTVRREALDRIQDISRQAGLYDDDF